MRCSILIARPSRSAHSGLRHRAVSNCLGSSEDTRPTISDNHGTSPCCKHLKRSVGPLAAFFRCAADAPAYLRRAPDAAQSPCKTSQIRDQRLQISCRLGPAPAVLAMREMFTVGRFEHACTWQAGLTIIRILVLDVLAWHLVICLVTFDRICLTLSRLCVGCFDHHVLCREVY